MLVRSMAVGAGFCVALAGCGDSGRVETDSASATMGSASLTASATESTGSQPTDGSATEAVPTEGSASASASASGSTTNASTGTTPGTDPTSGSTSATMTMTNPVDSTTDVIPPNCGDGVVDGDEECDDGPANGPGQPCLANCILNRCGDGVQDPEEECDLGDLNGPDNGCSDECKLLASACGNQKAVAQVTVKPVDIIIIIDNSGSMSAEIKGVEQNINDNFAQIIEKSGLDYRVIMVSRHGNSNSTRVCIEEPLSGIPAGGCPAAPQPINNPGKFYHYSHTVASRNAWCKALQTFNGAGVDEFGFAPMGWQTWLREDSLKVFLAISDDRVSCSYEGQSYEDGNTVNGANTAANNFEPRLFAKSPLHFGDSAETRNYVWYSLIGMAYNMPPEKAYAPEDPIITAKCPQGVNAGPGHQALSNKSGGLKFPLCDPTKYDAIFTGIANEVVEDAKISCEFAIPEAPQGTTLDEDSIVVAVTPDGQNEPILFQQVDGIEQCDDMSFYVLDGNVILCPAACTAVQSQKDIDIEVEFTCEPLMPN